MQCLTLFRVFQSHGAVPAAAQQVPPVFSRHSSTPPVHLHQVCQPVSRDKTTDPAGERDFLQPQQSLSHTSLVYPSS